MKMMKTIVVFVLLIFVPGFVHAQTQIGGGTGGASPAGPGIPTYNGPNIIYVSNYGSVGNGQPGKGVRFFDGSFTSGSKTVTVGNNTNESDPCVTSAMIGWLFHGANVPSTSVAGFLSNGAQFAAGTTITAVASCTSFTVSNNAGATCTSGVGSSLCQIVIAPYDDQPAYQAALNQIMPATGGNSCNGKLVLPQGISWIGSPLRVTSKCNALVSSNGTGSGVFIEGQGAASTTLFLAPGTWTTSINQGALFYNTSGNNGVHLANFSVDGAGQLQSVSAQGYLFVLGQNSSMSYVNAYQWAIGQSGVSCVGGDGAEAIIDHGFIGAVGIGAGDVLIGNYCKSSFNAYFWSLATSGADAIIAGTTAWSTNDTFDGPSLGNGLLANAGEGWVDHAEFVGNSTNKADVSVTSGAILHLTNSKIINPQSGTNPVAIQTDSTPSIVYLQDSTILFNANSGKAFNNAGTIYDLGGNTIQYVTNTLTGTYNQSPFTVGSDVQLAKAAAQAAKTLFTVGASTTLFRAHLSAECTTTSAAATVTPSILYTDTSNTVQTITGAAATCTALGAASNTSQDVTFRAKNATAIQYQTVIANTPTYDISVNIEQLGIN